MEARFGIKTQDIQITPDIVFEDLEREFGVDLRGAFDPCPYPESESDGLTIDWQSPCYCNPPFSKASLWVLKAKQQAERGVETYMMLPWYSWYQNSAIWKYGLVKGYTATKQRYYTFANPINGTTARLNCRFVHIKK